MQSGMIERYDRTVKPVVFGLWTLGCSWIVYSRRWSAATDGVCKDNTSKDPFSQCESPQGIGVGQKLSKWSQRQE